ncbi:hypothetical protein [Anaerotignum sp.]
MEKGKKSRIFLKLLAVLVTVLILWTFLYGYAFGVRTCGNSEAEIHAFLERNENEVEILKISEKDRIKAVIYEREDIGTCYAVFEKKLFGLRLEHDGMNGLVDEGLQVGGGWHSSGLKGSKCDVIVCGDNRDGRIDSYELYGVPEVARSGLEADYILDIYILDGIDHLPERLLQYTADGALLGK